MKEQLRDLFDAGWDLGLALAEAGVDRAREDEARCWWRAWEAER